jgi:hypothetical protein
MPEPVLRLDQPADSGRVLWRGAPIDAETRRRIG